MAEALSELVSVQFGVETVPGTPTSANRRFTSFGVNLGPALDFDEFTPAGYMDPTIVALVREESEGDIDGRGSYNDLTYLLNGVLTTGVITTPTDATTARLHTFEPNPTGVNTPKSFTVERSNGVVNERAAGCRVQSLDLDFGGDNLTIGGTLRGGPLESGITMTGSPTAIAVQPVMRSHISVYIDAPGTDANDWDDTFGTTKLTRARVGSFSIGDRFSPFYAHDAANENGPATWIERRGTKEISLTMMRDATAMALLANTRNGDIRQLRVEAVGPEIETDFNYTLTIDLAVQAVDGFGAEEDEGAEITTVTFRPVYSATWGRSMRVTLQNAVAAL